MVYGRVQGVFFRAECQTQAARLGLGGWVRNRADGGVEAVFEGDTESVAEAVSWCRSGPPFARVDTVQVSEEEPLGETDFRISH